MNRELHAGCSAHPSPHGGLSKQLCPWCWRGRRRGLGLCSRVGGSGFLSPDVT